MKEKSRQVLGKTKKIKNATLVAKTKDIFVTDPEEVVYEGEKNAPPLEMTDELLDELVEEEKEKEEKQKEIRSRTEHFSNGVNEWKLIAKTYNNLLDWEHVTTAMNVGSGCIVCVKEAIGQKMTSTVTFVPGVYVLLNDKGLYQFQTL